MDSISSKCYKAAAMILFVVVVGLMAKIELRDREWSTLDLSES